MDSNHAQNHQQLPSQSSSSSDHAKSSNSSHPTQSSSGNANRLAGVVQKYKVFEKLKKLSGGSLFSGSVPG